MGAAGSSKGSQVCCYRKGKKNDGNVSAVYLLLLQFRCVFPQQTDTDLISPCDRMLIKK